MSNRRDYTATFQTECRQCGFTLMSRIQSNQLTEQEYDPLKFGEQCITNAVQTSDCIHFNRSEKLLIEEQSK